VRSSLVRARQGDGFPTDLQIDGHGLRRLEALTGAPRRRRWSAAEKLAIVAESLVPGEVASTMRCAARAALQPALCLTAGLAIDYGRRFGCSDAGFSAGRPGTLSGHRRGKGRDRD
jgi:hypothetical protein